MKLQVELEDALDLRVGLTMAFREMTKSAWTLTKKKDGSITMVHAKHGSARIRSRKDGSVVVYLRAKKDDESELFKAFCGFLQRNLLVDWKAIRRVEE